MYALRAMSSARAEQQGEQRRRHDYVRRTMGTPPKNPSRLRGFLLPFVRAASAS
jgi:hypothetical protein